MRRISHLTLNFLKVFFRDRTSVFWLVLFPIILLTILVLIFSAFDNPEKVDLRIVLLKSKNGAVSIIENVFKEASRKEEVFTLTVKENSKKTLRNELEKLKEGKTHAIVVIPDEFERDFNRWMAVSQSGRGTTPPKISVYITEERMVSKVAEEAVRTMVNSINGSLLERLRMPLKNFTVKTSYIGTKTRFVYKDYLFPAIIIFSILSISMFAVAQELVEQRSKGIFKRVHLTPVRSQELLTAFGISRLVILSLVLIILSLFAKFVLKVNISPLEPAIIKYSTLSIITFVSMGFMLAGVIGNPQQAALVSNLSLQVMQFLSGAYFDVFNTPIFLRWIVYINPMTYLVSGVRHELGILKVPYSFSLSYLVPVAWTVVSLSMAFVFFRWTEER